MQIHFFFLMRGISLYPLCRKPFLSCFRNFNIKFNLNSLANLSWFINVLRKPGASGQKLHNSLHYQLISCDWCGNYELNKSTYSPVFVSHGHRVFFFYSIRSAHGYKNNFGTTTSNKTWRVELFIFYRTKLSPGLYMLLHSLCCLNDFGLGYL